MIATKLRIEQYGENHWVAELDYLCWGSSHSCQIDLQVFRKSHKASPDSFSIGFWLAQVPANSPSFFAQILMAIPANANPNKPMVSKISFIVKY